VMYSSVKWRIHVYHVCIYIYLYICIHTYTYVNLVALPHCLTHSEKEGDSQCIHEYSIHEFNTYPTVLGKYSCIHVFMYSCILRESLIHEYIHEYNTYVFMYSCIHVYSVSHSTTLCTL